MSELNFSVAFDLTGEFGGIIFTDGGKRRLLLRTGENERLLKVPKHLRRRMVGNFRPGETIRVGGSEERDLFTGKSKWVVSAVLPVNGGNVAPTPPAALPAGPIRVCAKKNCWRQGGRELFAALERGIASRGLAGEVQIKAVSCLDRCSQAPNIEWGKREFSRCILHDTAAILDEITAAHPPAETPVADDRQGVAAELQDQTGPV